MKGIALVKIEKRGAPYGNLRDVEIRAGNTDVSGQPSGQLTVNTVCGRFRADKEDEILAFIFCDELLNGRFVTLQQEDSARGLSVGQFYLFTKAV